MKDLIVDANFPRTLDQRVYHLGLRAGEVANRIITVGSPSRAGSIASFLDAEPKPFRITSERGFLTITGRYKGVPVSICSIGMGHPNMDFFVREVRECLSGDMIVVRLGSCGCLLDHPVGTIVVPKACVAVSRNYDYDFGIGNSPEPPYRISKPVEADQELAVAITAGFQQPDALSRVLSDVVNASADSFYSSQGRQTSFPDHNQDLIPTLLSSIPGLATLEMETHHLYHLAASYRPIQTAAKPDPWSSPEPPITTFPPHLQLSSASHSSTQPISSSPPNTKHEPPHPPPLPPVPTPRIRAAAAQIIFASRTSTQAQGFITPDMVGKLEKWTGKTILGVLAGFHVDDDRLHPTEGSVWDFK